LIVPCAELLEGKFGMSHTPAHRAVVRFGVVAVSAVVAVILPGFVEVLSLVGCFCVAMVGFNMPPLLHLRLMWLAHKTNNDGGVRSNGIVLKRSELLSDVALLAWGIVATVISTICTLKH
jgi:amino acid permease